MILEEAGHKVVAMEDEKLLRGAGLEIRFDVVVVGHCISLENKRLVFSTIRRHCPSAKILELHRTYGGSLDNADSWLEVPLESPEELAERVTSLSTREGGATG
jgi:hypothetical protein